MGNTDLPSFLRTRPQPKQNKEVPKDADIPAFLKKKEETVPVSSEGTTTQLPVVAEPSQNGTEPIVPSQSPSPSVVKETPKVEEEKPFSLWDTFFKPNIQELDRKAKDAIAKSVAGNPTTENINQLAQDAIKKKADILEGNQSLALYQNREVKPFKRDEYVQKRVGEINNNFISGTITAQDVSDLRQSNPLAKPSELVNATNEQLATGINSKTKSLRNFATSSNIDGNRYYQVNKDLQGQITDLELIVKNSLAGGSQQIFVDPSTTKLTPEGSVQGKYIVNRDEYAKEQQHKLNDLKEKNTFLQVDFNKNRYEPAANKYTNDIVAGLKNTGQIDWAGLSNGLGSVDLLAVRQYVNKYLADKNDPVINAANGVYDQKGNKEYNDMVNRVTDYFNNVAPVEARMDVWRKGGWYQKKENQKFAPLVQHLDDINTFFNNENTQVFENSLKATTDSNQVAIYKKYNDIMSSTPAFKTILAKYQKMVADGVLDQDKAAKRMEDEVGVNPELQKLVAQSDAEIKQTVIAANKEREKRLINGVQGVEGVILYDDGTLGIKGATKDESKQFFKEFRENEEKGIKNSVEWLAEDRKEEANKFVDAYKNKYGGFLTSLGVGLGRGYGNMMESATRWMNNSLGVNGGMRDYYTAANANLNPLIDNSDLAEKHFKYNGIGSLADPSYYAYNIGQSTSYMAPAVVASAFTGGGAAGAIIAGTTGAAIETAQNGLEIYNKLLTNGKNANGLPITPYEASNAMAEDMGNEILPNILLQSLEFGTLLRGSKLVKPKLNILGGLADLGKTGLLEGGQEGLQGVFQYNAEKRALGENVLDIFDYMQTDDFRQNFFGGLAGGIGFGAGSKVTNVLGYSKSVKDWQKLIDSGNAELSQGALYGYVQQAEKSGIGAQFRDGIKLRLENQQYKDDAEKEQLGRTLAYSERLANAKDKLGVSLNNVNGMGAAHNLAMSDMYETLSTIDEGKSALSKVYKSKAKEYLDVAKNVMNGKANELHYVTTKGGANIFLQKDHAQALEQEGVLDQLHEKGIISDVSDNLKLKAKEEAKAAASKESAKTVEEKPSETSTEKTPEQVVIDAAKENKLGVYGEMVNADPKVAGDVLRDIAQQVHGVTETGSPLEGGSREKEMQPEVVAAAKKAFPTPESTLISKPQIQQNGNEKTTKESGEISKTAKEESESGKAAEGLISEKDKGVQPIEETPSSEDHTTVGDMLDKKGSYKGQRGTFVQEGQTVEFRTDDGKRIYELGNVEEIKGKGIKDFGIAQEQAVVNLKDDGTIESRGKEYSVSDKENPLKSIRRNKEGDVTGVTVLDKNGNEVTFRGQRAEDLAYQLTLKDITNNNEKRDEFEQFINEDETASKEMESGTVPETTEGEAKPNTEEVQREKIEPAKSVEETPKVEETKKEEPKPKEEKKKEPKSKEEQKKEPEKPEEKKPTKEAPKTAPTRQSLADELKNLLSGGGLALASNPNERVSFSDLGIEPTDTISDVIDKLIARGSEFSEILTKIKNDPNFKNIKLELVDKRSGLENGEQGLYYPEGNKNAGLLQIANKGNVEYAIVHELMHFMTLDSAVANEMKDTDSYKALEDLYNYIASKKGKPVPIAGNISFESYGLSNVKEFMAELLINPKLRQYAADIFAANKEDILKTSKQMKDAKIEGIGDLIYNFFKDLFAKLFGKESSLEIDANTPVIENAARIATDLFFGNQEIKGDGKGKIASLEENKAAALALPSDPNSQKILNFVKNSFAKGATEEDVKGALLDNGISEEDAQAYIDEANAEYKPKNSIDEYEMTTSEEVGAFLSGGTIQDVFGDKPEGSQSYEVQKLSDMLQDGKNMIATAQEQWGNDVGDYGKPLFEHIQNMSNDNQLTNKKAVLMATFLGELKDEMIRNPERRGELQPLYNAVEAYYQKYMNLRGKEIVAGRLLRLYRDKYMGDVFADKILEEDQAKAKKEITDAEQKKKIDDATAAKKKTVTKEQKDKDDKAANDKSKKDKKDKQKKNKMTKDEAKKEADKKESELKKKGSSKQVLIDKINDAIKRLNCK